MTRPTRKRSKGLGSIRQLDSLAPPQAEVRHYPALDSLRGLAALIVVIHHHLLVFPSFYSYPKVTGGIIGALLYSPLHLIWAGGEAVLLFFILSGFVLSLSVWQGRPLDMQIFLVRRVWRIWMPFISAVTLAALAAGLIGAAPLSGVSSWFNAIWQQASPSTFVDHLMMLGPMDRENAAFIPVVWSLKWEMWGSLLLPLVLLLARQSSVLVLAGCAGAILGYWGVADTDTATGLLRYLPMFVLGALLARQRLAITSWVAQRHPLVPVGLLILALLLIPVQWYGYSYTFGSSFLRAAANDDLSLLGAMLLIVLAISWPRFQSWMNDARLRWLGRISFSLYLYHALVLTVVVRLGTAWVALPWLIGLSFILTFPVAHFAYQWIERPATVFGKQLAARRDANL